MSYQEANRSATGRSRVRNRVTSTVRPPTTRPCSSTAPAPSTPLRRPVLAPGEAPVPFGAGDLREGRGANPPGSPVASRPGSRRSSASPSGARAYAGVTAGVGRFPVSRPNRRVPAANSTNGANWANGPNGSSPSSSGRSPRGIAAPPPWSPQSPVAPRSPAPQSHCCSAFFRSCVFGTSDRRERCASRRVRSARPGRRQPEEHGPYPGNRTPREETRA